MVIELFHFTNSNIEKFVMTKPKRSYSMASGYGIYFTTSFEKGMLKYGVKSKYCYVANYTGDNVLNLGEFDSMYYSGEMIHSSSLVSENFRRIINNVRPIKEPEIQIEKLSKKAFKWLCDKGYGAITGMNHWGYCCPEFVVLDVPMIQIIKRIVL